MQKKLGVRRQAIIDQFPVDQIFAVINWNPGKKFKRGRDEIKIISDTTDAGIRVKNRECQYKEQSWKLPCS